MVGGRHDAETKEELSLLQNEMLIHHHWVTTADGWMYVETLQGAQGIVPATYVSQLP